MEPAISLRNVTKRYGDFTAVRDLSLDVPAGELFACLGPNGAGKTTTIKMICGLLLADEGSVHVFGHPMGRDAREAKALLAYLPDQPFLYDKLSGSEFLHFVGQMYQLSRAQIKHRVAELAEQLEMASYLDQLTESYSHGMKQRVALAAALLHRPRVLVIDEPMVGLDPKTVRTVKDLMNEMVQQGNTVFMSTHTLEVAEVVADRIGIINHGQLIAVGTLDELRHRSELNSTLEDIFLKLTADKQDVQSETVPT